MVVVYATDPKEVFMKHIDLKPAAGALALLLLASPFSALAQGQNSLHHSGPISDYSTLSASVEGSPWGVYGLRPSDQHPISGSADLSAGIVTPVFRAADVVSDASPSPCGHKSTASKDSASLILVSSALPGLARLGDTGDDEPTGCCCMLAGGPPSCSDGKTKRQCDAIASSSGVDHTWKEGKCE
jgi:hypothetical protein